MRKFLHVRAVINALGLSLAAMIVSVFFVPASSSEALFREISNGNERMVTAIDELNAYYAESPGFKFSKAILIDTVFLERNSAHLERREHTSLFSPPMRGRAVSEGGVLEWEGTIPESSAKIELKKIQGKFYGSYHDNSGYHIITPYRSGGEWITMMLVYERPPPECGMEVQAGKADRKVD